MDLAQIEAQLRELEDRYQEWAEPISLAIRHGLGMPGTEGPPVGDFREHVRKVLSATSSDIHIPCAPPQNGVPG